ncbi:hypothetical protein IAT38_000607 [Cryptococcus sp. DSM 104549]
MSTTSHSSAPPQTPSGQSASTAVSIERDLDAVEVIDLDGAPEQEEAVHFCLLAEFDIDAGATLAHQYPYPTGTDEHRLAELMLPDGAHLRPEDWTVFYLGQTASSAVAPMLSHDTPASDALRASTETDRRASVMPASRATRGVAGGGLLYVLNCVRMKEDVKMRRGAMVKAMAICTPNPYIGIYKPLLLLALEEYFNSPSPEILERLFDSANAISVKGMPPLSRYERILLRSSERKDLFEEKFGIVEPRSGTRETFDDGNSEAGHSSMEGGSRTDDVKRHSKTRSSPSGARLARAGSASSSQLYLGTPSSRDGGMTPELGRGEVRKGVPRDTHFFETEARFKKITVPIRIPMTVFNEDVGDYSLIELIARFSPASLGSGPYFPPPYHPHLHTNGSHTNPIILILNALLAHKRVLFLGHGQPANQVARSVLAACALGSGCGQVLRGMTDSAFPYANLASLDILEEFSGYVAGVTNPRFEELPTTWDVLCNLETGKVTVSKALQTSNVMSMKSGRSSETSLSPSIVRVDEDPMVGTPQAKMAANVNRDCPDLQFMKEIGQAQAAHYGEANIRLRFTDYLSRFTKIAAHQEYINTGSTKIGYPTVGYKDGQLGTGIVFADDQKRQQEMATNSHRIDAWRKTNSYKLYVKDWQSRVKRRAIEFDIQHQVSRLRMGKNLSDGEADAIFSSLANGVRSYDQVVELLTLLPPYSGGLIPIANGLFHSWLGVRENTIDLLITLQQYPVGRHAVATMNYFHRKAFIHLLDLRQKALERQQAEEDAYTSPTDGYGGSFASPGTVHGSTTATPQGVVRGS